MHMRLCFSLSPFYHIGAIYLQKINWIPVSEIVESCIATTVLKCWKGIVPSYINDMFNPSYT